MATGRSYQLTRQIGEHLVASRLGRLGYIASPFAGNVPEFDLLIANENGRAIPVQVKAINGVSWQFKVDTFLNVEIIDDEQFVKGPKELSNPHLICVFVALGKNEEKDEFFVFTKKDLQEFFLKTYKGGRRPKNPQSLHCAIWPKDLAGYKDNWGLIEQAINQK